MQALLKFFIDLALLRRGPQDLPPSPVLLALLAALSTIFGTANGAQLFGGARTAFAANLLDLALTLAAIYVLLAFVGRSARWLQTATAFIGLGTVAGLVMMVVRGLTEPLGVTDVAVLVDLVVAVWLHVALGGVLRHALDVPLLVGVMIVLGYTVMAFSLVVSIFPLVGVN